MNKEVPHHLKRLLPQVITNLNEEAESKESNDTSIETLYQHLRDTRIKKSQSKAKKGVDQIFNQYLFFLDLRVDDVDYDTLKCETRFLASFMQFSFYHIAIRLKIIRDKKLYQADGYPDFKSFIEEEIPLSRSTIYNYIDIVTYFGVQPIGHGSQIEYTKLLPLIPLLKKNDAKIPKEMIRSYFIKEMSKKSKSEISDEIEQFKMRYGITKIKKKDLDTVFGFVIRSIPPNPDEEQKKIIRRIIDYLSAILIEK